MNRLPRLLSALVLSFGASQAGAAITFDGSSGMLAASVQFDIVGGQLQVRLANTSLADVLLPTDVLTAVYFNIAGNPMLSRVSGISDGTTYDGTTVVSDPGATVGGEWAYLNGLSQYGANSGISSSGMGIFGAADVFPGDNLSGPADPDGLQYGLTSAGDNLSTGNTGVQTPLTKSAVIFTLGSIPTGFSLSRISNVTFQYGTALSEGHFSGGSGGGGTSTSIPEPQTVALLGAGAWLLALARRRRR